MVVKSKASIELGSLTKQQIITEITKSTHGKLESYISIGQRAASEEPEFFAHLIAWNQKHGAIDDSKVALPVIALAGMNKRGNGEGYIPLYKDNALAHLALLGPRELLQATEFARSYQTDTLAKPSKSAIANLVEAYLQIREANPGWWERTALQHRRTLKTLYARNHIRPSALAQTILYGCLKKGAPKINPFPGTVFAAVRELKNMSPQEAAGTIMEKRIPFLIAKGALGAKMKEPDVILALLNRMSGPEIITNAAHFEKLGVKSNPALRGAFEEALKKASESKRGTFKTSRAVAAVKDEGLKDQLRGVQERQIVKLGGVEGNWLVLGDKSSSMSEAIEVSRQVAATIAKMVTGKVHLVFFDAGPRYIDATGKNYDELLAMTATIEAYGPTSIGCGVAYAHERGFEVDGIVIVSDGAENTHPSFAAAYKQYMKKLDKEVPVYFYQTKCYGANLTNNNPNALEVNSQHAALVLVKFDLRHGEVDYYSLPNIVKTMRTNKYSLVDEVMETPLLTLVEALKQRKAS